MGSNPKGQTAIDRISNLPNNLITHILSFLSIEDAVRTCTLSTHWYQQWVNKTNLDFFDGVLINDENSTLIWNPTPRSQTNFVNFVNFVYRVLLSKVTRLDLFRLIGGRDYGVGNVTQWLSIALSRNAHEIYLMTPLNGRYFSYNQLFSSRSLVILSLGGGFFLKVPENISLESLKILRFNEVQFVDNESLSRLVSSCLVLEELKIEGQISETMNEIRISSPLLKSLILIGLFCLPNLGIDGFPSYQVVLNTPSLRHLEHTDGGMPVGYHIESAMHCVDEVSLNLFMTNTQADQYDDELILPCSMVDLAVAISNVRILNLSGPAFEAFYRPNHALPIFPRLTDLVISSIGVGFIGTDAGLILLTTFLQISPQLASLTFALEYGLEVWVPPTDVPSCMLHNLKVIKIIFFGDPEHALNMVKYFLENTKCLEKLILPRKGKVEEFTKEVLLLPRASNSCKFVLN